MAVNLSPIGNGFQFFTTTGLPLAGGYIYTYVAGSTTPQTTYTCSHASLWQGCALSDMLTDASRSRWGKVGQGCTLSVGVQSPQAR